MKTLILILFSFLALQVQAQNQKVTYKCHTTFSNNSPSKLPLDWYMNGDSHQFTVDSLNQNGLKALKVWSAQDSIKPFILTLTTLPVNRENKVTFSLKVKTQSANDSLLIVVSAMDTMAIQWIKGATDWKGYRVSIPLGNNSQIMVP